MCQHAQKHVGAHPVGQPVVDRPDLQIDALEAAEGALDQAQRLVTAHRSGVVEYRGGQAGAHDIDAVEGRLGGDFLGLAGKAKAIVGNVEGEVLGHFVLVEHGSDFEADCRRAAQRLALAGHRRGDARQFALGSGEQILAPAGALGRQCPVAADDQAFAGEIG